MKSDILLASDVSLMSDDCHTLIDVDSGFRINPFGGQIFIDNHCWIGDDVLIMGNSYIGENCVVGARSFVRNIEVDHGSVIAGQPAKVIRRGVTWDRNDYFTN